MLRDCVRFYFIFLQLFVPLVYMDPKYVGVYGKTVHEISEEPRVL